ncbi:MAG TPA: hypothetical protein PK325_05535 [Cyclobacteriaceae bacterium]|nr:hypothetical protein [Cyclobacteriaceae bacterium]HMV08680.1 hypothetical protein [Cyclobacteriaceae bacterium]HMV91564.1 hypothetical protein [Cyclobacteriaceae bacterium]HMX00111.1 hypothetical protein [Cyclobacteriaceae bacterium]HMX49027.1 hypothetical protein [Cyclobacteriaceae bacterium]
MSILIVGIFALTILTGYFLVVTPFRLFAYWLAIFLHITALVGSILKILHLPGGDEMLTTTFISSFLSGTLIFWRGIQSAETSVKMTKILLGLCIIVQPALSVISVVNGDFSVLTLARYLAFPIVMTCAFILLKKSVIHVGEKNLMSVALVHAIFAISTYFSDSFSSVL